MAAPVFNPEMIMNSFQKNLSHDVEDRNNQGLLTLIQSFAGIQIATVIISFYAKFYLLAINTELIVTIIACAFDPTTCNFPVTPTNFHLTDTQVQNIRAATKELISNPSAQNVDALLKIINSVAITNTSSIHDGQDVQQKHFNTFPAVITKVASPFVQSSAKSQMTTSTQDNIEFKANADGPQIPYPLPFPLHSIVPYSHFQWPMYPRMHPELLRPLPVNFRLI